MPVKALNTRVLVDQWDFSGDTAGGSLALQTSPLEAPALQQTGLQYLPGPTNGTLELNGYWNTNGAGTLEYELQSRLGSEAGCIVSTCLDTTAVGNPAYTQLSTWAQQLKVDAPTDSILMLNSTWTDVTARGYVIAHQTFSATGNGSIIDFVTAGTNGGWAVLHVRAISGTATNASFLVQHSTTAGFASPATLATFANFSAIGAQAVTFSGAVRQYLRLNCAGLGGATSIAVTAIVGVSGVTGA
mgnify:CR=1 FL=1